MITAAADVSGHGRHIGLLLGPVLLLAFWAGWADLRAWMHRRGDDLPSSAVLIAAAASLGAGLIHALVTPAHFSEDPLYGGFFVAAAAGQLAWAVQVVRQPSRRALWVGIAANLFLITVWAQSRLLAIPVGVSAGRRESVGSLDLACVALEAIVVVCSSVAGQGLAVRRRN